MKRSIHPHSAAALAMAGDHRRDAQSIRHTGSPLHFVREAAAAAQGAIDDLDGGLLDPHRQRLVRLKLLAVLMDLDQTRRLLTTTTTTT